MSTDAQVQWHAAFVAVQDELPDIKKTKTAKPLCTCHDVPMQWNRDVRKKAGGYWRCRVRLKEHARRFDQTPRGRAVKQERDHRYRLANAEQLAERRRVARATNPYPNRERVRRWARANLDQARALSARTQHRRRARRRGVPTGPWTRREVWERDHGRCWLCAAALEPTNWHVDHVIPLSRGGSDTFDNVRASCPPCNIRKGTRLLTEEILG